MPLSVWYAGLILIFLLILTVGIKYHNYRKLCKSLSSICTGVSPYPILGHLPYIRKAKNEKDFDAAIYELIMGMTELSKKEGLFLNWVGILPVITVHTAKNAQAILSSQVNLTKGLQYKLLWQWLKQGLLTSTGNKWKSRRKLLTPTFHYKILEEFQHTFDQGSRTFVEKLGTFVDKDCVNIVPLVTRCTLGIICETAMGIKLESQEEEAREYEGAINQISGIFMKRVCNPWFMNDTIFKLSRHYYKKWQKMLAILHNFTRNILGERKEEIMKSVIDNKILGYSKENGDGGMRKKQAFLDLLVQEQLLNNSLTDEDICEEVDTFAFEGHDTTATAICWTLYHLGCHPDIQEQIYEELYSIFGDSERSIVPEDLKKMHYLECVIKESLRLSPPVPIITRFLTEDVNTGEYIFPKDTSVSVNIYCLHRDPDVFPNPEVFDPTRFLPEACVGRDPFAYVPFSAGPRNCIGQRFALMELKTVIANVIRSLRVESIDPPDRVRISLVMILRPIDGLRIKFRRRIQAEGKQEYE